MKSFQPMIAGVVAASCLACAPGMHPAARSSPTGQMLFRMNCASCHGENADGKGPVAPLLTVAVPDLTRIAARRGGRFPDDEIYQIIDGQAPLAAHGSRHMPVWGYEFFGDEGDDESAHAQAADRVDRLVAWLRGIQRSP